MKLLIIILAFVVCIAIPYCYKKWGLPAINGKWAEVKVGIVLKMLPDDYYIFNDIIIRSGGKTAQIDHVVVSVFGIFVIETKSHKGLIYGGESAEYWTQNIWGHKYQLYNPLLQNMSHIRALQRKLQLENMPYIPIVVFTRATNVSVNTEHIVISHWNLYHTIRRHKTPIIDENKISTICSEILTVMEDGKDAKSRHRHYAKTQAKHTQESIRNGLCPHCGGKIVERHGRYGRFYGCSNYPNCRFTMKA